MRNLFIIIAIFASGFLLRGQGAVGPEDLGRVVQLESGDTLETLANTHLGSPEHAKEILAYNALDESGFQKLVSAHGYIAIPGLNRTRALEAFIRIETLLQGLERAEGEKYAPSEYRAALNTVERGADLLTSASYDKAEAHFALTENLFHLALEAADQAAQKIYPVKILRWKGAAGLHVPDGPDANVYAEAGLQTGEGAEIVTRMKSRMDLAWGDRAQFRLLPGTQWVSRKARKDERTGQAHLLVALLSGAIECETRGPQGDDILLEAGPFSLVLPAKGRALVSVDPQHVLRLAAYEGEVKVGLQGEVFALPQGQGAILEGHKFRAEPLVDLSQTPLASFSSGEQQPALHWMAPESPASKCLVEISSDPDFVDIQQEAVVEGGHFRPEILPFGTWHWRIRGLNEYGIPGPASEVASIEVESRLEIKSSFSPDAIDKDGVKIVPGGALLKLHPASSSSSVVDYIQIHPESKEGPCERKRTLDVPGMQSFTFCGLSATGIKGPPLTIKLYVDTMPPLLSSQFEALPNTGKANTRRMKVVLTAQDDQPGPVIEVAIGEGDFVRYEKPLVIEAPELPVIKCRAIDAVGNTSSVKTFPLSQF